jgi:hypothetical protein
MIKINKEKLYEKELEDCYRKRERAYKNESDVLFFEYQQGKISKEEWLQKIEEIKQRFPKPEKK